MSTSEGEILHRSVLLEETLSFLSGFTGGTIVDATLGMGGHTEAILDRNPTVNVLGLDQDPEAIAFATSRLSRFGNRIRIVRSNFSDIKDVAEREISGTIMGIIADLGVSSLQFDSDVRGFSFRFDAPLDMRMDAKSDEETAAELLETRSEEEIANIIYQYGEERASRKIARRIIERRNRNEPIKTTKELADLVAGVVRKSPKDKIHPATRTFQALRIAVNREIDILAGFLEDSIEILDTDGVLAVISFHSLEDRIVKQTFQRRSGRCFCPPRIPQCVCGASKTVEILTKKPITPGADEMSENPRSRSAKLRAVRKVI